MNFPTQRSQFQKGETNSPTEQIETAVILQSWQLCRLGDCAVIAMGQSPSGETYNAAGKGIPLINGPAEFGPNHPTPVQWTTAPTKVCKPNDILFCVRGNTTGRMNIADREYCIGRGVASIRGISGRSDTFFLWYLLNFRNPELYNIARAGGSTFPNLGRSQLADLPVRIPQSLDEQRAIARALDAVQKAKEARRRELSLERERKAALIENLFTHGTRGEVTKQTEIGEVPESWGVVNLIDAVKKIDYGISAPIPHEPPSGGVKIVSTADITKGGRLLYGQIRTIKAPEKTVRRLTLRTGDVLFNWRNSAELIGKTAVFEERSDPHVFASFILRIECEERKSHNVFLAQLLNHWREKGVFVKLSRRAVNQANYNRNELSVLKIPQPTYEEQREIAQISGACENTISAIEHESLILNELFQGMLEELMTGRLSALRLIEEHQVQ